MTGLRERGPRDAQSFDHLAGRYRRFAELTSDEVHAWLSFRLPARAGRAVDLGCGTGAHTGLLATRFTEVLAVDVSAPMLQQARTGRPAGNVRYEQRDLGDVTREEDGRFDTVLSTFALHHLPDLQKALEHLSSLTRPGGQVLVVDHVDDEPDGSLIDRDRLERHMSHFLMAALGGPKRYTGRGMAAAHASRWITDEAFDRVLGHVGGRPARAGGSAGVDRRDRHHGGAAAGGGRDRPRRCELTAALP